MTPLRIDATDRIAWQLHEREGQSWQDIAAHLGEPVAHVRMRVHRYRETTDAAAAAVQPPLPFDDK